MRVEIIVCKLINLWQRVVYAFINSMKTLQITFCLRIFIISEHAEMVPVLRLDMSV